jgi:hypothetical protein
VHRSYGRGTLPDLIEGFGFIALAVEPRLFFDFTKTFKETFKENFGQTFNQKFNQGSNRQWQI